MILIIAISLSLLNKVTLSFHTNPIHLNKNFGIVSSSLHPLKASISSKDMNNIIGEKETSIKDKYDAWSDIQEWALKDNISKYTITIPANNYKFILWNTMINEVTELHGYSIPYLQSKIQDETNNVVPYITNYEFMNNGGIKGEIYYKNGIADGSMIVTDTLINVVNTLPLGYVQTVSHNHDTIGMIYELGHALNSNDKSDLITKYSSTLLQSLSGSNAITTSGTTLNEDNNVMDLIKNVGGVTALALGSGIAYNLMTHHLTVNVFWV